MKRAVLYTRVSTCDQNPETQALDLRRLRNSAGLKSFMNTLTGSAAQRRSVPHSTRCWPRPTAAKLREAPSSPTNGVCQQRLEVPGDRMTTHLSMPTESIECPLCLGEGKLKRTEVLDRLGVKDFARVAQLSAEEAFRLLLQKQEHSRQNDWARFESELARAHRRD